MIERCAKCGIEHIEIHEEEEMADYRCPPKVHHTRRKVLDEAIHQLENEGKNLAQAKRLGRELVARLMERLHDAEDALDKEAHAGIFAKGKYLASYKEKWHKQRRIGYEDN